MTNSKTTKRALFMSMVSLLVCFTMLMGATFAWFTDTVSSTGNKIQAGTLDVKLLMHNGTEYADISESTTPIFGKEDSLAAQNDPANTLWEPGKTQIVYLAVENAGSLALKYNILVDVEDHGLVGSLKYAIIDGVTKEDADAYGIENWAELIAVDGVQTGDVLSGRTVAAQNGSMPAGNVDYFALAVHMDELAGNEYQDKDVVIDIEVIATQLAAEFDSFDNTYDEDAPLESTEGMVARIGERYFDSLDAAFDVAKGGDTVELLSGYNTQDAQLTETIVIDKDVKLVPNGMYLVSNAPSTFTVKEGGKLTVDEGSFTIKNTATNGAAVLVDGGEFVMAGGSFDAHTAVRTTEDKSSTVTLAAGWSNRVTVGFDSKGNDTINVTGGSLYTSKEAIKTTEGTHVEINMSDGLLSGKTDQYSAVVNLKSTADFNMTGGTIESTYQSGYNGSPAILVDAVPTEIDISGDAKVTSKGNAIVLGDNKRTPEDLGERFTLNVSGDATISAISDMGFGIRFAHDCCDVKVSGNATVNATYQAIQMNMNNYVFSNSTLTIAENAKITSTAGRIGGGYAIAANGKVTITGGTISGSTAGVASFQAGAVVTVDNSESGTPITINKVDIAEVVNYTVKGNPTIG